MFNTEKQGLAQEDLKEINQLTYQIIGCAYKVFKILGPGLLESTYEACMEYELIKLNCLVERQKALPLVYDEIRLEAGYRIDMLINNQVLVEIIQNQSWIAY